MNATETQYVEKLKELVEHVGGTDPKWCHTCKEMLDEISALEQQISEEVSYPREFVEWIISSRMAFDLIFFNKTTPELFEYWQSKVEPK